MTLLSSEFPLESISCPPERKKQTKQKRLDVHITKTAQTRPKSATALAARSWHVHCLNILYDDLGALLSLKSSHSKLELTLIIIMVPSPGLITI